MREAIAEKSSSTAAAEQKSAAGRAPAAQRQVRTARSPGMSLKRASAVERAAAIEQAAAAESASPASSVERETAAVRSESPAQAQTPSIISPKRVSAVERAAAMERAAARERAAATEPNAKTAAPTTPPPPPPAFSPARSGAKVLRRTPQERRSPTVAEQAPEATAAQGVARQEPPSPASPASPLSPMSRAEDSPARTTGSRWGAFRQRAGLSAKKVEMRMASGGDGALAAVARAAHAQAQVSSPGVLSRPGRTLFAPSPLPSPATTAPPSPVTSVMSGRGGATSPPSESRAAPPGSFVGRRNRAASKFQRTLAR